MAGEGRVLLADDDDVGRYVVATMLRRAGFAVEEAPDGATAVEAAQHQPPDVAILDVKMPALNGFEACRVMKTDEGTRHVPVLLLSATFKDDEARVEGLEGGADAYLTQPVESPVLVATVRSLMRFRQLEHAVNESARQWGATFDAISDAVVLVDGAGVVQRANHSFERLLGLEAGAAVGRSAPELVPALAPDRVLAATAPDPFDVDVGDRVLRARIDLLAPAAGLPGEAARVITMSDVTALRAAELERAGALEREREISRILQESLLPERLPRDEHVELDAWHVAAEQELIVGGDWYDAIETPRGLWLAIADVAGHGVAATAQAGQLRHTLRVYAHEGFEPAEAMLALNELVASQRSLATMLLAVIAPGGREVGLVNAGHPPPLLLGARGAELIEEDGGPALGIPASGYTVRTVPLAPGERLLVYTDGLVERPREHLDIGLERLRTAAEGTHGLADLRERLVERLIDPVDLRDDVALLLARVS